MRTSPLLSRMALLLALAACDAGPDHGSTAVARDSAGISIIENRPADEAPEWRLSADPAVSLGAMDAGNEYELYQPLHALRLEDGRMVVANQGTEELRFYGPGGGHLRTVGRKGGGPGEFQDMWGLVRLPGDSLGVWDWTAKRLTVFGDSGELGRLVTPTDLGGFVPRLIGAFDDGSFLVAAGFDAASIFQSGGGLRDDSVRLVRLSLSDGSVVDTLGPYPGDIQYVHMGESGFWIRQVPFGRRARLDAMGNALYVGDDRAAEVRVYDPDGQLVRIARLDHAPVPVTDTHLARYRERELASVEASRLEEERRRQEQLPTAATLPAFTDLSVDQLGRIWLQLFHDDPASPGRWIVLGPQGHVAASIELPPRSRPLDAGEDYVLLYLRDELDIEHLALYGLERSGGA